MRLFPLAILFLCAVAVGCSAPRATVHDAPPATPLDEINAGLEGRRVNVEWAGGGRRGVLEDVCIDAQHIHYWKDGMHGMQHRPVTDVRRITWREIDGALKGFGFGLLPGTALTSFAVFKMKGAESDTPALGGVIVMGMGLGITVGGGIVGAVFGSGTDDRHVAYEAPVEQYVATGDECARYAEPTNESE